MSSYLFDLEKAIAAWRRPLEHNRAFSGEDIEELENSLCDRVSSLVEAGRPEEEAFRLAVERMGSHGRAEEEYRKVYWGKVKRRRQLRHELMWRLSMLKSYLKTALRNLLRQKGYSFVNITGLTVGLACSFFILLWVTGERSVNQFHQDGDRIYRVLRNETNNAEVFTRTTLPGSMGPTLTEDYPEIENATYVWHGHEFVITSGDQSFREQGSYVSTDFFDVFTFPLIQGNPAKALEAENSAVISEALARRLFGPEWRNSDVIGKTITVNHDEDFAITGIAHELPDHSTIQFEVLLPIHEFFAENDWAMWDTMFPLYVRLRAGSSPAEVNRKIANVIQTHSPEIKGEVVFLQPFEEVYLHGRFENGVNTGGRIELVRIFTIVAIFLLAIAAINFMNLATARSTQRSKEIGVRKAIGATQPLLTTQFVAETMLLALLSFVLATGLVVGLLPAFNLVTGKSVHVLDLSSGFLASALGIALLTGLLAGSYPALYLSSFNPVAILRGTFRHTTGESRMRKGLVVFQFALSTLIIICTAAVYFQIRYILERDLGLDRGNIVSIELDGGVRAQYEAFRQELMKRPGIVNVTASAGNPLSMAFGRTTSSPTWAGKDPNDETEFSLIDVSYDFVETMKMELVAGRAHSRLFGADSTGYIINEETLEVMGKVNPVDERLDVLGRPGTIIGVVKNFHTGDISVPITPAIIRLAPANTSRVWIRTKPNMTQDALAGLEAVYKEFSPGYPFSYSFMDQEYEEIYRSIIVMGRLANVFAVIAIFISGLGLFALASFTAERRTKEIGIRKVLGASVPGLVARLSTEFLKLVGLAVVVAAPLAYVAIQQWLDNFAYRASIGPGVFLLTAVLIALIAFLTVSYQSIKAALADPVKSLRCE